MLVLGFPAGNKDSGLQFFDFGHGKFVCSARLQLDGCTPLFAHVS